MAAILLSILGYLFLILLLIVFVIFCLLTLYIYHVHRKYAHLPQVPMTSFYFGHKSILDEGYDVSKDKCNEAVFYDMHTQLGSPPVFVQHILHLAIVCVVDPKTIKEVGLDKRHPKPPEFYKTFRSMLGQRFVGRGILTEPDYEQWHKRRVILDAAFHRRFLKDFMEPFNERTELFIKKLSEKADGKTEIRMSEHLNRCTLDILAKVAFGLDLDIIENEDSTFNKAVLMALYGIIKGGDPLFLIDIRSEAKKLKEEIRNAAKSIREIGRNCINKRIDEMNSGKEIPEDILAYVIKAGQEVDGDDKEKMEVMIDEFALFFVGGMETTANLLSITLLALGRHPEILHRLITEVDAVLGDKASVSYEDINKLEYMMQVFKETLRLWPPISGMARKLTTDIDVQGFKIPAGSLLSFPTYLMARMEKFFHNAHDFDPDRFKSDEDQMLYTYFPFSFGPKSCIGKQFALIEARVILSRFLKSFRFELVPGQKFTFVNDITMKPKEGCKVYLTAAQ